jgi:teichuronic acid biosynthesis glycosyltransferase TuaG
MESPLVSIILPLYNSENYIENTIESICKQTYQNWELLITDDSSSDNSFLLVRNYSELEGRIRLFRMAENRGAGAARNYAIKRAKGRYIAFCDSDDLWKPEKLETQVRFMLANDYSFTCSGYDVVDESGNYLETICPPPQLTFNKLLRNNYVGCLTAIYDTHALGKLFMSEIRNRQDWVLWLNILKRIDIAYTLNEPLAIYRKRLDSISSKKVKLIKFHWRVYHSELNFGVFRSIICLFKNMVFHFFKRI